MSSGLADNGVITEGIDVVLGFTIAFTREEADCNSRLVKVLYLLVGDKSIHALE
jgi:hypothetical protein